MNQFSQFNQSFSFLSNSYFGLYRQNILNIYDTERFQIVSEIELKGCEILESNYLPEKKLIWILTTNRQFIFYNFLFTSNSFDLFQNYQTDIVDQEFQNVRFSKSNDKVYAINNQTIYIFMIIYNQKSRIVHIPRNFILKQQIQFGFGIQMFEVDFKEQYIIVQKHQIADYLYFYKINDVQSSTSIVTESFFSLKFLENVKRFEFYGEKWIEGKKYQNFLLILSTHNFLLYRESEVGTWCKTFSLSNNVDIETEILDFRFVFSVNPQNEKKSPLSSLLVHTQKINKPQIQEICYYNIQNLFNNRQSFYDENYKINMPKFGQQTLFKLEVNVGSHFDAYFMSSQHALISYQFNKTQRSLKILNFKMLRNSIETCDFLYNNDTRSLYASIKGEITDLDIVKKRMDQKYMLKLSERSNYHPSSYWTLINDESFLKINIETYYLFSYKISKGNYFENQTIKLNEKEIGDKNQMVRFLYINRHKIIIILENEINFKLLRIALIQNSITKIEYLKSIQKSLITSEKIEYYQLLRQVERDEFLKMFVVTEKNNIISIKITIEQSELTDKKNKYGRSNSIQLNHPIIFHKPEIDQNRNTLLQSEIKISRKNTILKIEKSLNITEKIIEIYKCKKHPYNIVVLTADFKLYFISNFLFILCEFSIRKLLGENEQVDLKNNFSLKHLYENYFVFYVKNNLFFGDLRFKRESFEFSIIDFKQYKLKPLEKYVSNQKQLFRDKILSFNSRTLFIRKGDRVVCADLNLKAAFNDISGITNVHRFILLNYSFYPFFEETLFETYIHENQYMVIQVVYETLQKTFEFLKLNQSKIDCVDIARLLYEAIVPFEISQASDVLKIKQNFFESGKIDEETFIQYITIILTKIEEFENLPSKQTFFLNYTSMPSTKKKSDEILSSLLEKVLSIKRCLRLIQIMITHNQSSDAPSRLFIAKTRGEFDQDLSSETVFYCMITEQKTFMLNQLMLQNNSKTINWNKLKTSGYIFWAENNVDLKKQVEKFAFEDYKVNKQAMPLTMFFVFLQKQKILATLFAKENGNQKFAKFFAQDFNSPLTVEKALANAFVLKSQKKYDLCVSFFVLAKNFIEAAVIVLDYIKDIQFFIFLYKCFEDEIKTNKENQTYFKEKIDELFIEKGREIGDVFLSMIGFLILGDQKMVVTELFNSKNRISFVSNTSEFNPYGFKLSGYSPLYYILIKYFIVDPRFKSQCKELLELEKVNKRQSETMHQSDLKPIKQDQESLPVIQSLIRKQTKVTEFIFESSDSEDNNNRLGAIKEENDTVAEIDYLKNLQVSQLKSNFHYFITKDKLRLSLVSLAELKNKDENAFKEFTRVQKKCLQVTLQKLGTMRVRSIIINSRQRKTDFELDKMMKVCNFLDLGLNKISQNLEKKAELSREIVVFYLLKKEFIDNILLLNDSQERIDGICEKLLKSQATKLKPPEYFLELLLIIESVIEIFKIANESKNEKNAPLLEELIKSMNSSIVFVVFLICIRNGFFDESGFLVFQMRTPYLINEQSDSIDIQNQSHKRNPSVRIRETDFKTGFTNDLLMFVPQFSTLINTIIQKLDKTKNREYKYQSANNLCAFIFFQLAHFEAGLNSRKQFKEIFGRIVIDSKLANVIEKFKHELYKIFKRILRENQFDEELDFIKEIISVLCNQINLTRRTNYVTFSPNDVLMLDINDNPIPKEIETDKWVVYLNEFQLVSILSMNLLDLNKESKELRKNFFKNGIEIFKTKPENQGLNFFKKKIISNILSLDTAHTEEIFITVWKKVRKIYPFNSLFKRKRNANGFNLLTDDDLTSITNVPEIRTNLPDTALKEKPQTLKTLYRFLFQDIGFVEGTINTEQKIFEKIIETLIDSKQQNPPDFNQTIDCIERHSFLPLIFIGSGNKIMLYPSKSMACLCFVQNPAINVAKCIVVGLTGFKILVIDKFHNCFLYRYALSFLEFIEIKRFENKNVCHGAFSRDSCGLYLTTKNQNLIYYDFVSGTEKEIQIDINQIANSKIFISKNYSKLFFVNLKNNSIFTINEETMTKQDQFDLKVGDEITCYRFHDQKNVLIVGFKGGILRIYNTKNFDLIDEKIFEDTVKANIDQIGFLNDFVMVSFSTGIISIVYKI